MLVLTRKTNESIMIGNDIEIKVIGVEGDQVKIGIEAPRNVEIHRREIYIAIQDENRSAVVSGISSIKQLGELLQKNQKK